MKLNRKQWQIVLTALGLLVLGFLYLRWLLARGVHSAPWGLMAATGSALLFALAGLLFVPRWIAFWSPDEPARVPPLAEEPAYMSAKIFLSLLCADMLVLLLAWLLRRAMGHGGSFAGTLDFWRCTDSRHYLDIARDWYLSEGSRDRLVQLVFLPGYPVLVRLMRLLIPHELYAGLLVSALCLAGAGCLVYRLLRLDMPHGDALRGLVLLCLTPGAFFFAAPMSEGLFLLLCAACLYLARARRFFVACLCGGLAAFTRSLGLTLLAPLALELGHAIARERLSARDAVLWTLALLLVPAGFGVYCYVNYTVAGDAFQFMVYQAEHWGQRMGLFFNTAAYQTELAVDSFRDNPPNFWGLWLPNLLASFSALGLLAAGMKKLRPSYAAWALGYYVIAIGPTWLLSAPRYLLPLLPLTVSATFLTKGRWQRIGACALLAILSFLYFLAFLARWQVW